MGVDAKGMFLAAVGAGPVYKLLGKKDLGTGEFPPIETPLTDGDLAFRQHSGGHTPAPNWPTFLTFASRYLKVFSRSNVRVFRKDSGIKVSGLGRVACPRLNSREGQVLSFESIFSGKLAT